MREKYEEFFPIGILFIENLFFFRGELVRIVGEQIVDFLSVEGKEVEPYSIDRIDPPNAVVVVFFVEIVLHGEYVVAGTIDDGRRGSEVSTVDAHFGHEFPHRALADDGGVGVVGKTNVALSRLNFEVGLCGPGIECTIELCIVGHKGSCERRQGGPTANLGTRKREMHVDVAAVDFE